MIDSFSGDYFFLLNFYRGPDGKSVEHKFQAAKATSEDAASWILSSDTPGLAKLRGRSVLLRDDWEYVKVPIMANLVAEKFKDPILRGKLLSTGTRYLCEGNTWGDTFWGFNPKTGIGHNYLGVILMSVRSAISVL